MEVVRVENDDGERAKERERETGRLNEGHEILALEKGRRVHIT